MSNQSPWPGRGLASLLDHSISSLLQRMDSRYGHHYSLSSIPHEDVCAQYCFQEPRVNAPTLRSLIKTEVVNGTTMDNILHQLNGEELFCQDFESWPSRRGFLWGPLSQHGPGGHHHLPPCRHQVHDGLYDEKTPSLCVSSNNPLIYV